MKLFYCKECDQDPDYSGYSIEAIGLAKIPVDVTLDESGFYISTCDRDDCHYDQEKGNVDLASIKCCVCESTLIIVEIVLCPHDWESTYGNERKCALCGKRERGKVVWGEQ